MMLLFSEKSFFSEFYVDKLEGKKKSIQYNFKGILDGFIIFCLRVEQYF